MRLVLHIGTHKTGSSSIQSFLTSNSEVLVSRGFWYAIGPDSPRNVNFLGNRLALGGQVEARRFLAQATETARQKRCHTVILSGESFYAMNASFHLFQGGAADDYWVRERRNIEAVRDALPVMEEVRILCYVRRQDLFLESLYNQLIKQPRGITWSIAELRARMEPMLDYHGHLRLWGQVFGDAAVHVRPYDAIGDAVDDFLIHALGITGEGLRSVAREVNAGLGAHVMELKRILNRIPMSDAEDFMTYRAAVEVNREMGRGQPIAILSVADRAALLDRFAESNWRLRQDFLAEMPGDPLAPKRGVPDEVYAGLTPEAAVEVLARMDRVMRRPLFRLEVLARSVSSRLRRSLPWVYRRLQPLRRLYFRHILERERRGLR